MCVLHHLMLSVDVMALIDGNMKFALFILWIIVINDVMSGGYCSIHGGRTWPLVINNALELLLEGSTSRIQMQRLSWNLMNTCSTLRINHILIQICLRHIYYIWRPILMPLLLFLLRDLLLLVHHLLLLRISQDHLLCHLTIISMDHLGDHCIWETCFSRWYHLILIITPIIIVHFFNLFFLILILMWNDLLLFLPFLRLCHLFLFLLLKRTRTLLRLCHRHNHRARATLFLWLHFKLLLLFFFVRIIKGGIRVIHFPILASLVCMLLLEPWRFYI